MDEDSTLSELRGFVKDNGLDVKTAGPGRNKAAILADIQRITASGAPAAEEPAGSAAPKPAPAEVVAPADANGAAETEATTDAEVAPEETEMAGEDDAAAPVPDPAAAPPDGFTWGGTF